jgi:hypothetical protein
VVAQGIGGTQAGEEIPGRAESGHPGPDALVVQAAKQEMSATDQQVVVRLVDQFNNDFGVKIFLSSFLSHAMECCFVTSVFSRPTWI